MDQGNQQAVTTPDRKPQTEAVLKALDDCDARQDAALQMWLRMCNADNGALFPVDLMAKGAIKRCLSHSSALRLLVESWNMLCARALVRLQIDTALRFSALWLVDKPHDLANELRRGTRLDKIKDRDGNQMRDAYLIRKREGDHPWLPAVYESLSGYVHFSRNHILSPIENLDKESREFEVVISAIDDKYPESSWLEVVQCFNESTDIFLYYLGGWIKTKEAGPGI